MTTLEKLDNAIESKRYEIEQTQSELSEAVAGFEKKLDALRTECIELKQERAALWHAQDEAARAKVKSEQNKIITSARTRAQSLEQNTEIKTA